MTSNEQRATSNGTILVTGANGFVGRALFDVLVSRGRRARRAVRAPAPDLPDAVAVGDLGADTEWRAALEGVDCVVHLAARTHVLRETARDPLAEYRRVNVAATERLARQARAAGVRRLVFLSSVKVNGESSAQPFKEDDAPHPEDAYGMTKREAEQALARVSSETGLEVVVLRPPLVYGPGVKGNFLRLMGLVARGLPLPLAAIQNHRSLVYVGNLVDAIAEAADAPQAAGHTYLVADGVDLSTPELVHAIADALGVRPRLLYCPVFALRIAAKLTGRSAVFARVAGSLQVDCSRIGRELGWRPPLAPAQGLAETARWYYSRAGT